MLMIDLVSHQMEHTKTEVNMQIRLTHYTVVDGHCIFGGYVGLEPILIIYDPFKNTNSIVPGFFLTETELLDVRPNKNSTFNILLSQHTQGKKKLIFRTLDKMGNILVEDEMAIDEEKTIMSGVSSVLEHDEVLIAGAFTFHNSKQASGIFNCVIDPFSDQPLQYTEFHQLQHFLDYLSDKKANKIKQKASQRENLGKPPEYRMNVGIHRIEEFKGGFALFGESFTMSTSGSANSVSSYSNPYSRAYGSSNGYQPFGSRYYTGQFPYSSTLVSNEMRLMEGFVIGFDIKGKRLWDYSITMDEFKTPSSEQVSDFVVKRNVPYFLFKDENELRFSNHNTDTIETKKVKPIPIKLLSEFEESKSTDEYEGNVRQWFGPNLYVWGVQTVRDSKVKGNDSRRVFYINKIRVD